MHCLLRKSRSLWIGLLIPAAVIAGGVPVPGCSTMQSFGSQLDDASISTQVQALLIQDPAINPLNVRTATDEGEVFLIGRVASRAESRAAEQSARSIAGVWSVQNYLKIGEAVEERSYADLQLRQAIEARLFRDRQVLGLNIRVLVHEAEVYLLGRVASNNERQQARNVVLETEGVQLVQNHLKAGQILAASERE